MRTRQNPGLTDDLVIVGVLIGGVWYLSRNLPHLPPFDPSAGPNAFVGLNVGLFQSASTFLSNLFHKEQPPGTTPSPGANDFSNLLKSQPTGQNFGSLVK